MAARTCSSRGDGCGDKVSFTRENRLLAELMMYWVICDSENLIHEPIDILVSTCSAQIHLSPKLLLGQIVQLF